MAKKKKEVPIQKPIEDVDSIIEAVRYNVPSGNFKAILSSFKTLLETDIGKYITSEDQLRNICKLKPQDWNRLKHLNREPFDEIFQLLIVNKALLGLKAVKDLDHSNHPTAILTRVKLYNDELRKLLQDQKEEEDTTPDIKRLNQILDKLGK